MINVVIVEDNNTIRNGLKEFLNNSKEYKCVADFSNCENLLQNFESLQIDVILMDIELPGISGIEGIKQIRALDENPRIIILTIYSESENLFEALQAGASGYLEKKTPPIQMLKVIGEVYASKSYMNTYIARKVLNHFNKKNVAAKNGEILEKPEFSVLTELIEGKSPKAIADHLQIPMEKVHAYFYSVYQKLHLNLELKKIPL
ncbi:MAG: response regulator transcription factor [Melioribacteraceae bacterium]|nr:MAG: response regulator transcription factor [Melioribacteraceae bacterium]